MQSKLSLRTLPVLVAALCLALPLSAQIYQWKDASGKTTMSDKPPPGQVPAPKIPVQQQPSPTQTASGQPSWAERDLEFRKRQKEAAENAEKAEKAAAAAAQKEESCQRARRQLQALETGELITVRDDKGERRSMDDAQREQEKVKMRSFLEAQCK
ncbi:hypothetical protein FACS1894158_02040 [Betaproteobacteria bacterium]|nr:hypothetical protein FACS1894158_02040 [Betaproteobacteria bacterium]